MQSFSGRMLAVLVIALTGLAIVGFLLGDHGDSATTTSQPKISAGSGILLEYPSSWRQVATAPYIPGLAIEGPVALAPGGRGEEAGLLSGRLPADQAGPLPAGLVSLLRSIPRTEVVDLANAQAYRYREVRLQGYGRALELYVIPDSVEGSSSVLACYASRESSPFMGQCEQAVAQVTLPGQPSYALGADGEYASHLAKLLGSLQQQRLTLREEMHLHDTPAEVASLASTLAERFAGAAASVRTLEPPQSAGAAQAALANAMLTTQDAYQALAVAASAGPSAAQTAQARVTSAESEVNRALEDYALLGYGGM
jgi:hypothetical protein